MHFAELLGLSSIEHIIAYLEPQADSYVSLRLTCRAVAALAEDPEMHFAELLEPGTMLWIHNPSIFHSRTEVVDGEASFNSVLPQLHCFLTASRITGISLQYLHMCLHSMLVTSHTSALGCRLQCSTDAAQRFSFLPG